MTSRLRVAFEYAGSLLIAGGYGMVMYMLIKRIGG